MPEYTLEDLAAKLGLTLKGGNAKVSGLNTLEAAGPDEVSFLANPRYAPFLAQTRACAVIVDAAHADKVERALISKTPYLDFGRALALFARSEGSFKGISDQAYIDPQAILGAGCTIYPFAYIGARARLGKNCVLFSGAYVGEDASIGDNCRLYPNAVVLSRVEMGEGCELHPGAVLGSDGFGFTRQTNVMGGASGAGESGGANGGDSIQRIPQAGFVRLGKAVSVGSNAAIDRGALGPTCIGDETKIDNLVQIGHNVTVGKAGLVVSQVGVSGSSRIGDRVTLAGQAGIAGHLKIGNDVVIGPQSGVAKDVPDGFQGGGSPLVDGQTFLRTLSLMPKLPELFKRLSRLEKELAELRGAVEK